jgi:hypothetical protein
MLEAPESRYKKYGGYNPRPTKNSKTATGNKLQRETNTLPQPT